MLLSLKQVANFTGATVKGAPEYLERNACGITWDSREVQPGYVYVALPGERVDGHSFVASAIESGAVAALVMQDLSEEVHACARAHEALILTVESTHEAFTDLARGYRSVLTGRVIGITGSTGKTTTKNLVRDVLSARFSTVATKANQNNELGVPRTLLNADPDTEMVVVEMGMRGLGQIEQLCDFVKPNWGLITNVGESHIELLGSRENIARAKAELFSALPSEKGVAFVNTADNMAEFVCATAREAGFKGEYVSFNGVDNTLDNEAFSMPLANEQVVQEEGVCQMPATWAEDIHLDDKGCPTFTLCAQGFVQEGLGVVERSLCSLSLRGVHNVSNACSAAAVGRMAGMSLEEIVRALEASQPESGRQEILHAQAGYTVINDAYNANPDSMRASLNLLRAMEVEGRRFAVLGDMGELGSFSQACHESVGVAAAHANLDYLVCVGQLARFIAQAAEKEGFDIERIIVVDTRNEALAFLKEQMTSEDAVLVKASHFMELDRVAKGLLD